MNAFPLPDPIPLPAPVWLLKTLHLTTMSLHFVTVELLLGGLLVATLLNLLGRSPESRTAAAALSRRLPIVMTFVINLGVPPLLFAQVLYGRALYTSSVLMGVAWILVIPLLMLCYWLLYRFTARVEAGRKGWWLGLLAWLTAGSVAKIYSSNMTLMLRPEAWPAMYAHSAAGAQLPTGDPTLMARWLFMLGGGLMITGLWMLYLAGRSTFGEGHKRYLATLGGSLAAGMAVVQVFSALHVVNVQPDAVRAALGSNSLYVVSGWVWGAAVALAVALGAIAAVRRAAPAWIVWSAPGVALLTMAGMAVYRDGIRDVTLSIKGFNVWDRVVDTNWSVVALFLVLFVAGLGAGRVAGLRDGAGEEGGGGGGVIMDETAKNPNLEAEEEEPRTRRLFLGAAGVAGACYVAALGYPVYRYMASPIDLEAGQAAITQVSLKDAQKLAPGTAMMFKFGVSPALLIHFTDNTWVALGAVCTHLGCTVQYQPERHRIYCACHGGQYDPRTGKNVAGPPPKPLPKYNVAVGADAVVVSKA